MNRSPSHVVMYEQCDVPYTTDTGVAIPVYSVGATTNNIYDIITHGINDIITKPSHITL